MGRFVVPLSRWDELDARVRERPVQDAAWPVSLLAAPADSDRIRDVTIGALRLIVEAVECKAESVTDAARAGALVASGLEVFVEPSKTADFPAIATELARSGAAAKIRTGGVTADAFPTGREVLAFLRTCREAM